VNNVNIALDFGPRSDNIDIMNTQHFSAQSLQVFLRGHKIATMSELRSALGNPCTRTVFRKLDSLQYQSSYSHRGRYYTLPSIAEFDALGLWTCRSVWFSRFGNLLDTAQCVVERSATGYTAAELTDILHVECKHTLSALVQRTRLVRERIETRYVYFAPKRAEHVQQRRARQSHRASMSLLVANPDLAVEEAKAAIMLFLATLNERQRRLYAGLESLKTGHGGDDHIAQLFGLDRHTVARGRDELLSDLPPIEGIRRSGGGRPSVKKKARNPQPSPTTHAASHRG